MIDIKMEEPIGRSDCSTINRPRPIIIQAKNGSVHDGARRESSLAKTKDKN